MAENDECHKFESDLNEEQKCDHNEQSNVQCPCTVEGEYGRDETVQKETVVVPVSGRNDARHDHKDGRDDLADEQKVHPTDAFLIVGQNELRIDGGTHDGQIVYDMRGVCVVSAWWQ